MPNTVEDARCSLATINAIVALEAVETYKKRFASCPSDQERRDKLIDELRPIGLGAAIALREMVNLCHSNLDTPAKSFETIVERRPVPEWPEGAGQISTSLANVLLTASTVAPPATPKRQTARQRQAAAEQATAGASAS